MNMLKNNWLFILIALVVLSIVTQVGRIKEVFSGWFSSNSSDLGNLDFTGSSLSELDAKKYAERLFSAMNRYGTSEQEIYNVFLNIDSKSDFNHVYKTFGLRHYNNTFGYEDVFLGAKRDLLYWLNAELNTAEKEYINENYITIF